MQVSRLRLSLNRGEGADYGGFTEPRETGEVRFRHGRPVEGD